MTHPILDMSERWRFQYYGEVLLNTKSKPKPAFRPKGFLLVCLLAPRSSCQDPHGIARTFDAPSDYCLQWDCVRIHEVKAVISGLRARTRSAICLLVECLFMRSTIMLARPRNLEIHTTFISSRPGRFVLRRVPRLVASGSF